MIMVFQVPRSSFNVVKTLATLTVALLIDTSPRDVSTVHSISPIP